MKKGFDWNEWAKVISSGIKIDPSWISIADFAKARPGKPMSLVGATRLLFALHKAGKAERKQFVVINGNNEPKRLWHYRLLK